MGHFGKKRKDGTYEWVTWQQANANTEQKRSIHCHEKDEPQIYRTCDKRLSFGNVQTWMEFSKQCASLKNPFPKHYFTN